MIRKLKRKIRGKTIKIAAALVLAVFLLPNFVFAEKVGWVTDIHAGHAKKKRKSETNIFYPRKYKKYFEKVSRELRDEGIETLILSGDITDYGHDFRRAKIVRKIARKQGLKIILAQGNHDDRKTMKTFNGQKKTYFYVDRYDYRIIVLDSNERAAVRSGGIKDKQFDWLEDVLERTRKPTVIVMHHPIFDSETKEIYGHYKGFEQLISSSKEVKMVISGHWHFEWFNSYNGIKYAVGNPLTLENKMGSYYIINLDNLEIESRYARI
ncbi:MAG: metallophosphoesterase [Parcubacteria group bacterium]|jgi:3',5'-cyclic AMP phosphodiesterase CpdA